MTNISTFCPSETVRVGGVVVHPGIGDRFEVSEIEVGGGEARDRGSACPEKGRG
jgi:hypothetical protein